MHFVTGGSFNGKSKWVRELYGLDTTEHSWISAYKNESIPQPDTLKIVVFEGVEVWLKENAKSMELADVRQKWRSFTEEWIHWERQDPQRKIILIGCDISKGIVPIDNLDRRWRDLTGWVYQDFVSVADRADVIWYGINHKLK